MIRRSEEDPVFLTKILWTDESRFERSGVFNIHNYHNWAIENPHSTRASHFQTRLSVKLWSGILNGQLIGPFELPARLDGNAYLIFLQNNLNELLENVNLQIRREMIFQQDTLKTYLLASVIRPFIVKLDNNMIKKNCPWLLGIDIIMLAV